MMNSTMHHANQPRIYSLSNEISMVESRLAVWLEGGLGTSLQAVWSPTRSGGAEGDHGETRGLRGL